MQQRVRGGLTEGIGRGTGLLSEFKEFILRGNVVSLAVAVLIASAFGDVVTSLTENIITPFIGMFGGTPDFSALSFTINESQFRYGAFINAVIAFLIVAAIIFFFIIKPMNALIERSKREAPADPTDKKCSECLSDIPIAARRCKFCTSEQPAVAA
ncbi:MAG TPA: large conductance mechanosensitive channel protein MscL [Thermomicrobiales bacterium]|jgi:large conductance mechanosensitive channel|nr:large conductance mechanosensitive channel protein MscL [Thermomicrobiales bacterium]